MDFLLDQDAADVHILITAQRAGNGGKQYQLIFYGQHSYSNYQDTLRFITSSTATNDEVREQMTKRIMMGLVPLIAHTEYASAVKIEMKGSGDSSLLSVPTKDKWNYWIFNLGADGSLDADQVYKSSRFSSDFSANRTTDKLKVGFRVYGNKRHSLYKYTDSSGTSNYTVDNSEYGFFNHMAIALGEHWSYGYEANYTNNTFYNYKSQIYVRPSIEYNVFPYSQVNNRFLVLRYGADVTRNNYYETTLYDKIKQTLYGQKISASLTMNQKWGTFYGNVYYRNYFLSGNYNSMGANLNVNVRITGSLSFYINSSGSIVHDQLYLVKGNATEQDVFTKQRQLASNFKYNTSFGINYRFGSKLNNFVNPRFNGYGGF